MPKAVKKKLGWSTIFHELKSVVKAKAAQNNSQVSEGGITVNPHSRFHSWIDYLKVNLFVTSVTCRQYQIAFKWSVNFWLQFLVYDGMENISMDEISIQTFFIQENWASRNFMMNLLVYSLLITQAKMLPACRRLLFPLLQQQVMDGRILANRNSANHPYCFQSNQKRVQIQAFLHVIFERNVSCPHPKNRWSQAN